MPNQHAADAWRARRYGGRLGSYSYDLGWVLRDGGQPCASVLEARAQRDAREAGSEHGHRTELALLHLFVGVLRDYPKRDADEEPGPSNRRSSERQGEWPANRVARE